MSAPATKIPASVTPSRVLFLAQQFVLEGAEPLDALSAARQEMAMERGMKAPVGAYYYLMEASKWEPLRSWVRGKTLQQQLQLFEDAANLALEAGE